MVPIQRRDLSWLAIKSISTRCDREIPRFLKTRKSPFNNLIQEADQERAMDITMCVMDVTNAVAWLHVALKFGKLWCGGGIQFQGDILVYMAMFD